MLVAVKKNHGDIMRMAVLNAIRQADLEGPRVIQSSGHEIRSDDVGRKALNPAPIDCKQQISGRDARRQHDQPLANHPTPS